MITQILSHTPLWVFGLFFGLVYLGYVQSRTRQVSRSRLTMLPIAMLAWSLYSVWSTFDAHLTALAAWACVWGGASWRSALRADHRAARPTTRRPRSSPWPAAGCRWR